MTEQSKRVRVLIVSPLQLHPTLSGGHLRTFSMANALSRQGADVFVYSFAGRKSDYLARVPSGIQTWPRSEVLEYVNRSAAGFVANYGSYWLGLPPLWLTGYLHSASKMARAALLPRLLRDKLDWCDVLIADSPFTYSVFGTVAPYSRLRVLNLHNVEHHLLDTNGCWRDRWVRNIVRRVELDAASSADVVVSCSDGDARYFEKHCTVRRSLVVPNGIDVERFRFPPEVRAGMRDRLGFRDERTCVVLFTASKWAANQEAYEYLLAFCESHERVLVEKRLHLLVVGSVVQHPIRLPALTATGRVDVAEPYFAAADAAINPVNTGSGTNVKVGEFIAARLPVLSTAFGARGYSIENARTGFIFKREELLSSLLEFRTIFDSDRQRLTRMSEDAFLVNKHVIDMDECVRPLVDIFRGERSITVSAV